MQRIKNKDKKMSYETLIKEVQKVRSPEQLDFLYNIVVLMRNNGALFDTAVSRVPALHKKRKLFSDLPTYDFGRPVADIISELREEKL
ncbi:hypothetical protein AGMMS49982_03410 [Bacteroidia bacterium]|nr:hypothetical protein AGMMS49982_03410 [Bacteroidia bacterium]